jgi:hypothetical protein
MILSGMFLSEHSTHCRAVQTNENKKVFRVETAGLILVDDFDMRESL